MDEKLCKNCTYFYQHYTFIGGKIRRIYCGHCIFSRPKNKRPLDKACENYVYGPSEEDNFASKSYLTKEMIKYLFNMEFLPPIEDATGENA